VRLTERNGYATEIVHGIAPVAPIPVTRRTLDTGQQPLNRAAEVIRFRQGPSPEKFIGHVNP
jgi:hypothetical protein